MERVLFGDNQFFAVNHLSDERSRAQAVRFKDNQAIIDVLDSVQELDIHTFMCTTHDRIAQLCDHIRQHPEQYKKFKMYPCMPYAHKYANAVTELGIMGTLKAYLPGNILSVASKGGLAFIKKDFIAMMELLVDAEMKMFQGINTPVIFLQNVVVDLLLGLGMYDIFAGYADYIKKKYDAEPGFITMNMCKMVDVCESLGIKNPIICTSINKIGFRMSGSNAMYETYLEEKEFRPVAMQVLAAGALKPEEAIDYVCRFPRIESILFGASSRNHIQQTKELIDRYSVN
ncbi:MAG: hypothetical protein LBN93_10230 [Candidatus Symbiothrix sp.]|jgi:hypothetical protein|nr:hypothetical protein [Candidatus Symbiothrix sp.]